MSFTQPICEACWTERNPHREAVCVVDATEETCCLCGKRTASGIYIRIDPRTVPHPRQDPE